MVYESNTQRSTHKRTILDEEGGSRKVARGLNTNTPNNTVHGEDVVKKPNKYMRKVLNRITMGLLEGGRVTARKIDSMKDHPELATYLQNALALMNDGRLVEIVAVHGDEDDLEALPTFDIRPIGARTKQRVRLEDLSSAPLTRANLEGVQESLIALDDEGWGEGFVATLQRKGEELRGFTFTDADVEEILNRRKQKQQQQRLNTDTRNYQNYQWCVERKMALNSKSEVLKYQIASTDLDPGSRQKLNQELKDLELELLRLESAIQQLLQNNNNNSVRSGAPPPNNNNIGESPLPATIKPMPKSPMVMMAGGILNRPRGGRSIYRETGLLPSSSGGAIASSLSKVKTDPAITLTILQQALATVEQKRSPLDKHVLAVGSNIYYIQFIRTPLQLVKNIAFR